MRALDTNVIIYHFLNDKKFGKISSKIISRIENGENVLIPLAVLKETMFILLAHGWLLDKVIDIISSFDKPNIEIVEDNYEMFLQGLQGAVKHKFRPTDGIIASVMIKNDIKEIYTNDKHFEKAGMKVVFE